MERGNGPGPSEGSTNSSYHSCEAEPRPASPPGNNPGTEREHGSHSTHSTAHSHVNADEGGNTGRNDFDMAWASWSNGAAVPREDNALIQSRWRALQDARRKTRNLWSDLSKLRQEMERRGDTVDRADDAFMALIRDETMVTGCVPNDTSVVTLFEEMRSARTEYRLFEQQLKYVERQINDGEELCEDLEVQFFCALYDTSKQAELPPRSAASSNSDDDDAPPTPTSLLGIPADLPDDTHPLYQQLLDAVADRELAYEQLEDLQSSRDSYVDRIYRAIQLASLRAAGGHPGQQALTTKGDIVKSLQAQVRPLDKLSQILALYHLELDEETREFFLEFHELEATAQERIARTKERVEYLKGRASEEGAMRKNPEDNEAYLIFGDTDQTYELEPADTHDDFGPSSEMLLFSSYFPILLSSPLYATKSDQLTFEDAPSDASSAESDDPSRQQMEAEARKERGISTIFSGYEGNGKSEFVNRWLLQRLRTSPMEVDLLYNIFSNKLRIRNPRRWQEDVLYYWRRDAANVPDELFRGPVTSRGTPGSNFTSNQFDWYPKSTPEKERDPRKLQSPSSL